MGEVPEGDHRVPIGEAQIIHPGRDITLVAMSYMTVEAIHAAEYLATQGVSCEVIDLRTIKPLDWPTVFESVARTGRVLALDSGFTGSVAGEVVARVAMEQFDRLTVPPARLAMPDVPEPTSYGSTRGFYVRAADIAVKVMEMMGRSAEGVREALPEPEPHDVPGDWFKEPF